MYRKLYFICLLFFILEGCACWVAVGHSNIIYTGIALLTIVSWKVSFKSKITQTPRKFYILTISLWIVYLISSRGGIFGSVAYVIRVFAMSTPFFLISEEQSELIRKLNKFFFVLVFLTVTLHFFKLVGLLPTLSTIQRGSYYYQNYFVYLYSPNYDYKCCGFCFEPGFFSLLLSVLLFINKYELKKTCVKLYLFALLITLSLGGYAITIVCWYLYYTIRKSGNISVYLVKSICFILVFYIVFFFVNRVWNNGHNVINENIVMKATDIGSAGVSLEARQSMNALLLWDDYIHSNSIFFGFGYKKYSEIRSEYDYYDASSVAEFMVVNGIVGTCIFVFAIGYYILKERKSIYPIIGLFLLILDFIQHGYGIESSMFILVVLWITYMEKKCKYSNCVVLHKS